ncbi:MAG: 2,3-bisphosphoglycerate-independent phosphoglycerate mutase [Proteobacteria bacterium]|nr:2,3-bisphosphoglycerate-independent phosphoglycerate mutase [Candidatus Enterousia scatequi]
MFKPIVLCILDGVGINDSHDHNAVAMAHTPFLDNLVRNYPNSKLDASGVAVGLPDGVMGNSEVGHITLGAGRIVNQFLRRFEMADFDNNLTLRYFAQTVRDEGGIIHVAALMSDGRVHSDIDGVLKIIRRIIGFGARVCIHFIADGRDTPQKSAGKYIEKIKNELGDFLNDGRVFFGTLSGRYYTMDRNQNLDRTKLAFDAIAHGVAPYTAKNIDDALRAAYNRGETDEFIKPTVITPTRITSKDGFMFGNYRSDRARQIMRMILTTHAHILCFSQYGEGLDEFCPALLPDVPVINTLGDVLAKNGKTQLRIAETEKYNHVTYFFDAERNIDFDGEDKVLIPSPAVATFDMRPEMAARKITRELLHRFYGFDVVILNYANGDMVGHTGNEFATIQAMQTLDKQLAELVPTVVNIGGAVLIVADHGNAEEMWNYKENAPLTAHTTNPVRFILASNKRYSVHNGGLADVAPTILDLLNIDKPTEMTGQSLID